MKKWMNRRRVLLWLGASALELGGCSSDAVPEPEPTVYTSGAFVAVADDRGDLELFRTLAVLGQGSPQETFFFGSYGLRPRDYEEATALAKRRDLDLSSELTLLGGADLRTHDWRVVWFRSLSNEEQAAFR